MHSVNRRAVAAAAEPFGASAAPTRVRRDYVLRRMLALADATAIVLALVSAFVVVHRGLTELAWGMLLLPMWILLFKLYGLYDRDGKRVSHSTVDELPWIFHALVTGGLLGWLLTKAVPALAVSGGEALAFFVTASAGLLVTRATVRALAHRFTPAERVLLIGGGPLAELLVNKILAHPEYGLDPIGYVDGPGSGDSIGLPRLGGPEDFEQVCRRARVDHVIVASAVGDEAPLADVVRVASGLDLKISILPQLFDVLGPGVAVDHIEGVTMLGLNPPALSPSSRLLKRLMDVSITAVVLVVMLPVLALAALAVKLSSPGPIFYRQERVGHRGGRFHIYKFRTMVADAEQHVDELRKLSAHPAWLLLENDPRITRVGRFLRHTSLDELPQLWNVLRGEMSLVGPRPMTPDVDEQIYGWGRRRLDLTPGITGLWQVLGRTNIAFEEMIKLDYLYVTSWSLGQDIRLLIHTLPAVVRGRGVN